MKSDVPLDYAIFHLTPTRTRCELLVASGKEKERLATGLIKPFLTHLKAVEDQISNGCCSSSSITLQPPPSTTTTCGDTNANASNKKDPRSPHDAPWFTKGTVERFVRFVSTPEVLEFVSSVEDELTQIEEAISMRAMESASPSSWGIGASLSTTTPSVSAASKILLSSSFEKTGTTPKSRHSSLDGGGMDVLEAPESTKRQVARAMDARRLVLHKEQGIAFTRAAAAGFDVQHMAHLLAFADCFGATRLRDACVKFMALCKKRQEACNYIEEMESAAMNSERLCLPVSARSDGSLVRHSRGQYADRQSEIHGNLRVPEASNNENDISSRSHCRLFNDGQAFVDDADMDAHSRGSSQKPNHHHHHHHQRRRSALPFGVLHGSSGATVTTNGDYLSHGHSACYHYSSTSMEYDQKDVFIEQRYEEDCLPLCQSGAPGLMRSPVVPQCSSPPPPPPPPPPKHSRGSRFTADTAGETCSDLGASHHRQGHRRSWARYSASHVFPAFFSSSSQSANSSRNSCSYNLDSDCIYPLESSCKPDSLQNNQLGPHPNQEGGGCVNGNGSQGHIQNLSLSMMLASDQNWQLSSRHTSASGISHSHHVPVQQNTQGEGCGGHIPTTHMERKNAVAMDGACTNTISGVVTEMKWDEILEHESQLPPKRDPTAAVLANSNVSWQLIPALPSPKQKALSAVQQPVQAGCSSGVRQQQHPGDVVPRSINYMSMDSGWLSADRTTGKDLQAGGILDCSLSKKQDDKEDDLCKEAPCRSLSVKDAISLFEVKRLGATEEFKKKLPRQQEPCRVSSTGTPRTSLSSSSVFEKPVLRRWSQIAAGNNSDCSHIETEQQSKDLCRSSPEDSCTQYDTTMINILPEPHQSTESFRPGVIKVVVSEASTIAPGMHGGEFSRMSVDSVLPPDSLAKYAAARSALLCSSGPDNDSSCYQEAHAEEEKDFVAIVESEGLKTRTVAKDQELVQPALPSFVLDASNTAVASQAASAEDNSSNRLRTGILQEVKLPDGDQHSSLLKESKFSTSENSPSIPPASDTDDGSLALNTAANQKSVSEFHHEESNGDVKHIVGVVKGETNSPQEPKGRFYEHYRERRDAKLREEPGSKRAEREAKLKAMHEVLEKRKEEMVACNNNNSKMVPEKLHSVASVDAQLHAEKLHNFKPELAIGRKSKDDEDKKLVDEMRVRRRERPAAVAASRGSPTLTASLTPRAAASQRQQLSSPKQNVVHKLSSPQKFFPGSSPHVNMNLMSPASAAVPGAPKLSSRAASQRWSATALVNSTTSGEILLSHSSGPCVAELRKENTKPLAVRSSTLHERKLVNKTINGTVLRSSTAPLEANRSQPAAVVSFNVYEDKKSRNSSMRRSLSLVSADLLQEAPPTVSQTPALKISKYLMVEQNNMTNKPMKHMGAAYCQAVTPDAKPFLRKGRGIGPGAGAAGVRKSKVVPGSLDPAKFLNEDIAIVTSLPLEDVIPRSGDLSMDTLKPEHCSATTQVATVNECNELQAAVETSVMTCCNNPINPPLLLPEASPVVKSNSLIELTEDVLREGDHDTETDQVSPASFEVHTEDYSCANLHMPASCTGSSQEVEVEPQLLEASSHEEVSSIYTSPAALDESYKKSSSPWIHEFSQPNNPPSNSSPPRSSTSCVPIGPPEALVVNVVAEKVSLESPPFIQSSPPHLPLFASSSSPRTTPFCERESYHAPCVPAAATVLSPSGVNNADDDDDDEVPHLGVPNSPPLCEAHSSSLAEEALSSHNASPIASQAVPALEVSLSPEASSSSIGTTTAARSRRKWGCAEKVQPPIIMMSKESPKGIRKLLKFGRKSRNSGCSFSSSSTANDWRETASTTTTTASDAEDADLELNNRMSFSNLTKRLERSWKNGGPQLLLHKGGRSVSAVRESSSSSSKAADTTAARSSNHAPRSFFSLSTFRSRSNESKSRS